MTFQLSKNRLPHRQFTPHRLRVGEEGPGGQSFLVIRGNRTAGRPSREKWADSCPQPTTAFFSGPVSWTLVREDARKSRISANGTGRKWNMKTLWRRGRDSNPRWPSDHSSFQDCPFRPLTHLSATTFLLQFSRNLLNSKRYSCGFQDRPFSTAHASSATQV